LLARWRDWAPDLPPALRRALSISGLYDLEPLMHTPSLQEALRLTPEQVRAPVRPGSRRRAAPLGAVVGGDESAEFLRQNRLIRQAWGRRVVPVCETLPGLNHFSVLDALVQPGHRLHRLARSAAGPGLSRRGPGEARLLTSAGARPRCRRPGSRS
jgi:arylformamidase